MQPLYCKAKNGKVKMWIVSTQGDTLTAEAGYIDGVLQEHKTIVVGKNIGKANETTGAEQAILEAASKYRKKLDEGYKESLDELTDVKKDADGFAKPMLATPDRSKVKFPCYVQPKLNGIRSLSYPSGIRSRSGKVLTVPHIKKAVESLKIGAVLDGELYAHGVALQDIGSLVKNPLEDQSKLRLWVYDVMMPGPYSDRLAYLQSLILGYPLILCPTVIVHSQEELDKVHADNKAKGFEGSIVRNINGEYEASFRSHDIIKYKDFIDGEYLIIGGEKGRGKYKNCCIFVLQTPDGQHFKCLAPGTILQKEEHWNNLSKSIGKMLTISYQELSNKGIPTILTANAIRDYE